MPPTPRILTPEICGARLWQVTPDSKDLEVHVVPTASGATVLTVPTDGGAVRGFRVDNRSDLFDLDMSTIREDRLYSHVQASIVADRLVVGSATDDKVALDIVRDDLGARHDLGEVSGSFVTPIVQSRENPTALVGGIDGITAQSFTGSLWQANGSQQISKASITSATAMSYHDDAIVAYSTADHVCHLDHVATGRKSEMRDGCDNAQLAVDTSNGNGFMIYEQAGSVMQTKLRINAIDSSEFLTTSTLDQQASQPRMVYDGHFFWSSYLDSRGDLVIGVMDGKYVLTRRTLQGLQPGSAYDLQVFNGNVWIVAAHQGAFLAERFCATLR